MNPQISLSKLSIVNAKQFTLTKLKVLSGAIPKQIKGSYIKNGTALHTIDDKVLEHWFKGDGGLLKVEFHQGNIFGRYKMVDTPSYRTALKQRNFDKPYILKNMVKALVGYAQSSDDINNTANTSILRLKNSQDFFALNQGGLPTRIAQKDMKQKGFDNLGFINKGFSAHPKIDPETGNIFNIGFNTQNMDVYKMTSDLKLLAKNSVRLRIPQSIHDCCLAGSYLFVFQCPVKFNVWKLLKGYHALNCFSMDYDYGKVNAYIFSKNTLQLVKKIQLDHEIFMFFHFTNGYQQNGKIYIEYAKYPGVNAQKIWDLVEIIPQYAKQKTDIKINLFSQLETLQINLQDFSYKTSLLDYDCQFPVCQDSEVGKKWQYSYFLSKQKNSQIFNFNKLVKLDRFNPTKALTKTFPNCIIGQPALIRTIENLYIMIVKTGPEDGLCTLVILNGQNLEQIAQVLLPELIPFGFHGKWLEMDNEDLLQCQAK